MAYRVPVVRQIRWLWAIPAAVVLVLAIGGSALVVGRDSAPMTGAAFALGYTLLSRRLIARQHRRGMRYVRARRWSEAVPYFRQSYEFFSRHAWIDRYRWLFLMSASAISYREMALLNEAFALGQQGLRQEARAVYQRALAEFPSSAVAESALNLMEPAT